MQVQERPENIKVICTVPMGDDIYTVKPHLAATSFNKTTLF